MEVRLVVEQGRRRRIFRLPGGAGVVGRARGNALRVPSAEVSRRHCELRQEGGLLTVEDLGSVNGTFLNGARVSEPQVVRPGDHLQVGPVTFVVEYELTPRALERLLGADEEPADPGPGDEEVTPAIPLDEDPEIAAAAQDRVALDLSFIDHPWQPPNGDLRDLLAQMEDEAPAPAPKRPKKKPRGE